MSHDPDDESVEPNKAHADLEILARWLDTRFSLFGVRFGLDNIIGLIPGVGDGATALIGTYLITRAWNEGASFFTLLRMLLNMLLDFVLGIIPGLGDIFDVAFRSNIKNVRLLQEHLEKKHATALAKLERQDD